MKIDFHLEQENIGWRAEIHQLNSDVLKMHILPRITSTSYLLDFEYCDKTGSGKILESTGKLVGDFTVY